MKISELMDKNILVWGYGIEGKSIVEILLKNNIKNKIFVATKDKLDLSLDKVEFISEIEIEKYNFDVVIKSPGISSYSKKVENLLNKGIIITSSLNIMLAEISENKNIKTIGITGTKGKSTTASICNHILNSLGKNSVLVGNVGVPFLSILENQEKYEYIVMELSSCQLNNIKYNIDYGVLLNLYPEHIDWHITHENYFKDKMNIVKYSKKCFLNYKDEIINNYAKKITNNYEYFNNENSFYINGNFIFYKDRKIFDINSLSNIKGKHIFENICSILSIVKYENLNVELAIQSLKNFKTLEHRLEIFYNKKETNTKFVDDSISTIPESTLKALETFKEDNILLILGGYERQQNYDVLTDYINKNSRINKVFLIGQTSERLNKKLNSSEIFNNFEDLVKSIKKCNLNNTTVLLSPAAASYDMFKNFCERGDKFKKLMLINS